MTKSTVGRPGAQWAASQTPRPSPWTTPSLHSSLGNPAPPSSCSPVSLALHTPLPCDPSLGRVLTTDTAQHDSSQDLSAELADHASSRPFPGDPSTHPSLPWTRILQAAQDLPSLTNERPAPLLSPQGPADPAQDQPASLPSSLPQCPLRPTSRVSETLPDPRPLHR